MAGLIPERQIEAVRFSTDIVDLIGAYVTLKKAGSVYKACCPFHQEKTPSFTVNPSRQSFKCFGCGEGGDCFGFMMKHQGLPFIDAVRMLAERAGIVLEAEEDHGEGARRKVLYEINGGLAGFYRRCLRQMAAAEPARRYLAERDLGGEVADTFGIGYAPDAWDATAQWAAKHDYTIDQLVEAGVLVPPSPDRPDRQPYDRFRNRLMFPILDTQSRVVGFSGRILDAQAKAAKYVNSPETPVFTKSRVLYGLDKAREHIVKADAREAVVCEGQIDVIRCHAAGIRTAVAAQGTAFTAEHVALLKRYADGIVIVFDSDHAGQEAAIKTARLFLEAGLVPRIARLPDGEDPDSYIRAQGAAAFRAQLDESVSVTVFEYAVLAARERDAQAMDAIGRLSKALLATIACCGNAVLRARMLQEAAEALSLPVAALTEELAGLEARAAHRESHRAPAARATPVRREPAGAPPGPRPGGPPRARPEPGGARLDGTPAGPAGGGPAPLHARVERELCEQLIRAEHEPEVVALVAHYVPAGLLQDDTCRELVGLLARAADEGIDPHEALGMFGAPEEVRMLAEDCIGGDDRISHREFSRAEAVQDLIRQLWRIRLDTRLRELARVPAAERTPDQQETLADMRMHWRELQVRDWDAVAQVIEWLLDEQGAAGGPAAADTEGGHADDDDA